MFCDFLQTILPNLISTIIGVVIGVPFAFFVNRKIIEYQELKNSNKDIELLKESLLILEETFDYDKGMLKKAIDDLNNNKAIFDFDVNIICWDIIKPTILKVIKDKDLKISLSVSFERLQIIKNLLDLYFNYSVGLESDNKNKDKLNVALKNHLIKSMSDVISRIDRDLEKIQGHKGHKGPVHLRAIEY